MPTSSSSFTTWPQRWLHAWRAWLVGWWNTLLFGAQVMVLALTPSSYRQGRAAAVAQRLYAATMVVMPGFTTLAALIALVVIRIVIATSYSYGLSRYALDVLVRTLVLELIPLSAALFVAVRYTLSAGDEVRALRAGNDGAPPMPTIAWLRDAVLPRALAAMFAVVTLAVLSGVLTLLFTYLSVYGFSTWGLPGFTRAVGQVFNPVVALIFTLKTLAFGLAVSVIPVMDAPAKRRVATSDDLGRLARLLSVILLVEVASLVGNYH